ncbi:MULTISPECIES: UDP-4-amino-4,6-dideoxy-N-acetyl-beta-L-altrosamine transaminase [unclassified Acidovorax]|uniref:UDP-4-amino-4, 6-dideoxy-N-acetyl-beta-L-altrosamine transaminase n=1 Tax=unclassified Acidovorax TaxID=2684926 RepID=UPI0037C979AC
MIPYGRQDISCEDIEAVVRVLRSDYLTQGPEIEGFEREIAAFCSAPHAIAVNSATSALHMACASLGVGPGDVVWTSPNSFTASANCARYCGANVDFVDIGVDLNMDPAALAARLAGAQMAGRLPKVVIPVDFAGRSCRMREIRKLADEYGFAIVEDASHAIGGMLEGKPVGGHGLADITVFSFHPVKIITSGEGGIAVTHNAELARRMHIFRTHGITRDPAEMTHPPDGPWYYQQIGLGFNYRITDLQAALGRSQLRRIASFVDRRHEVRHAYDTALAASGLGLPPPDVECRSALHLYPVRVPVSLAGGRDAVFARLRAAGVGVNVHYIPIHTQPYYQALGFRWGDFPRAEAYYREAISLPMYAAITQEQLDTVIETVLAAVAQQ